MLASDSLRAGRMESTAISLDALIPADHMIRKIDAAVDWEVRCAPLREYYSAQRGRPAFEPEVLLAIALLRHIYHMDSLRTASAEIQMNLAFRWFIGSPLCENVPHFSTVSANLLHRIPKELFAQAFAGALCDILDAGVLPPEELVYRSVFLTEDGEFYELSARYFAAFDQLPLLADIPSDTVHETVEEQLSIF